MFYWGITKLLPMCGWKLKKLPMELKRIKERDHLLNQGIIATIREPLIVMDGTLKVLNASRSFYKTFKAVPEETIGNLLFDLGNGQWDIPALRQLLTDVLEKQETVEAFEVDHEFQYIGHKVMILNARKVLNEDSRSNTILLAIEDVTARVELERIKERDHLLNQGIIATIREPLIVMDGTLKVLNASRSFYKTFKAVPEETIGNLLFDLGNGQWDIPALRQLLTDVLEKQETVEAFEVDHEFQYIGHKVMILNARKVLNEDSRSNTILLAIEDVTARVELERTKEVFKNEAVRANKAKSEFLASMSHDLRTPLNAIMGFSEMMSERTFGPLGDPHYEDYSKDILDSGRFLISLIDDVLDLSKIEAGKYELIEEEINIVSVISASIKMLGSQTRDKNIRLRNICKTDVLNLLADTKAITQVINNLVSNAVKFTPGHGEVTVDAWKSNKAGCKIQVTDTGIGMSKDDIIKAVKPFEQADSEHSRKHEGTGLGLHLCSRFIELHGGFMTIESEVNNGTTVMVSFPLERNIPDAEVRA